MRYVCKANVEVFYKCGMSASAIPYIGLYVGYGIYDVPHL